MPDGCPPDRAFELKLVFLHELGAGHEAARESLDRLMRVPRDRQALLGMRDFFHKIAGTSYAADLPLLGYLAAVCERACDLMRDGVPAEKVLPLLRDGMTGVASVLESHGSVPPRAGTLQLREEGMVQPGVGDERVLSKILVVDDDTFSANLTDSCLRSAGFMSSYCTDPEKAMETITSELPDLIILDVVMPVIDGFELCRRVRAHPGMHLTPIIFVTRRGDVEQRVAGLEAGGNDYIAKPFEPQELVARVRSHLQRLATLRDMAVRDGLTRCYNHKYFKTRLKQEVDRCLRYKSSLVLGMLDVDHFKRINDEHGHQAGDAVLANLGSLIMASVRSTDVVARYGGDEFGLLFIEAGASEARLITQRMLERIAAHSAAFRAGDETQAAIAVTVSVGVAHLTPEDTMESLIKRADVALYDAKANGRNQVNIAV